MKRLFSFFFFFAALNIALAQSKPSQKQFVTLGGIESGSKVSIMQVLDYPVLVLADKNEQILSFELTIISPNADPSPTFSIQGNSLNQNVKNYLENMKGKKGKIFIENIIVAHEKIKIKENSMVFYFEQ